MELSDDQRRNLIAMWCQVAWADGVVYEDERKALRTLFTRVGGAAIDAAELERWLDEGIPFEPGPLSDAARKLFVDEALALARSDGEFAPLERRAIEKLSGEILPAADKLF